MSRELLPHVAVIYGASGDLTKSKLLPAFLHLWHQRMLPEGFALVRHPRGRLGTRSRGASSTTRVDSTSRAR